MGVSGWMYLVAIKMYARWLWQGLVGRWMSRCTGVAIEVGILPRGMRVACRGERGRGRVAGSSSSESVVGLWVGCRRDGGEFPWYVRENVCRVM